MKKGYLLEFTDPFPFVYKHFIISFKKGFYFTDGSTIIRLEEIALLN